jgi:N utilization substance protein B
LKREDIREKTMQLVYQMDITGDFEVADLSIVEENVKAAGKKQAAETLAAVQDHHEEIDRIISDNLDSWTLERIAKTDLAILRTAVAEMFYVESIPVGVSINEAVELAKKYGDERSFAFINSVLGKISRSMETEADKK